MRGGRDLMTEVRAVVHAERSKGIARRDLLGAGLAVGGGLAVGAVGVGVGVGAATRW